MPKNILIKLTNCKIFDKITIKGDKQVERITIELNKELKQKVKIYCINNAITVREFITQLLKEKLM